MDACLEAMEAALCSLTYDLKKFFKQQGKVFWTFLTSQMGAFGTIGSHPDEDYSMRSSPQWAYMAPMWTYIAPWRASMAPGLSCTCEDVPL